MVYSDSLFTAITADKHLYALAELPILTVYDDNLFVRNDYDILSRGQRNYVIEFLKKLGFKLRSGSSLSDGIVEIQLVKPKRVLALSSYESKFNQSSDNTIWVITPSTFAEVLFHALVSQQNNDLTTIKQLINVCPYNIELIRDINYRTDIETITKSSFDELMAYQKQVIEEKFKFKRSL